MSDTGTALESVAAPGCVTVCGAHQASFGEVFDSINTRASKSHMMIYIGILSTVAAFFGAVLWKTTDTRVGRTEGVTISIERNVAVISNEMEHIKKDQAELKSEQRDMRKDLKNEFERLRVLIKNGR